MIGPEGIAFNSDSGNLYIVGRPANTLFEVATGGNLVQATEISAANAKVPAGLAYAPGSQNPADMNIYIAAWGVDNSKDPNENDGKIYELTLPPTNDPPTPTPPTDTATLAPTDTPSAPAPTDTLGPISPRWVSRDGAWNRCRIPSGAQRKWTVW